MKTRTEDVTRYADMFTAMGTESRLRIMQLLLSAHPEGLVVGEIMAELEISASTLSHHLEKLKHEGLVEVSREGTFLRYTANTEALQELLRLPLRRVLHPEQGHQTQDHHDNLPLGDKHARHQGSGSREIRPGGAARHHWRKLVLRRLGGVGQLLRSDHQ